MKSWCAIPAFAAELRELLGEAYDLERLAARVATGRATPRDLAALARTLALLPKVKARLTARRSHRLTQLEAALELCPEVRSAIEAALVDDPPLALKEGGLIRPGYHPELDRLRSVSKDGKSLDRPVPGRADPPHRHRGPEGRLQPGLRLLHRDHPRPGAARRDSRRTTFASRRSRTPSGISPPSSRSLRTRSERADERANALEYELFTTLRDRVSADAPRLIQAGSVLAQLDVLAALAELAARHGYCRPELDR